MNAPPRVSVVGACLVGVLLLLAIARAVFYVDYVATILPQPLENHVLEGKQVYLGWRVQQGMSLYPDWRVGPFESNFFGPVYFLIVGGLARWTGASIDGIFLIGRWVTVVATFLSTILLAVRCARDWGWAPGLLSGLVSLGTAPLVGFSVMTRPDLLAEFFGFAGFLTATGRTSSAARTVTTCALFAAAILAKQTAILFLIGTALGLWLMSRRRDALLTVAGSVALTILVIGVWALRDPMILPSMLGEAGSPFEVHAGMLVFRLMLTHAEDLTVLALMGIVGWLFTRGDSIPWLALAGCLIGGSAVQSFKVGADVNYFVSQRLIAGAAIGWIAYRALDGSLTTGKRIIAMVAGLIAGACVYSSSQLMYAVDAKTRRVADLQIEPRGRMALARLQEWKAVARDPRERILTDSSLLAAFARDRAEFHDPYLFKMMVKGKRIDPKRIIDRLNRREYTRVLLLHDPSDPFIEANPFALPTPCIDALAANYQAHGRNGDFFVFTPLPLSP